MQLVVTVNRVRLFVRILECLLKSFHFYLLIYFPHNYNTGDAQQKNINGTGEENNEREIIGLSQCPN